LLLQILEFYELLNKFTTLFLAPRFFSTRQ